MLPNAGSSVFFLALRLLPCWCLISRSGCLNILQHLLDLVTPILGFFSVVSGACSLCHIVHYVSLCTTLKRFHFTHVVVFLLQFNHSAKNGRNRKSSCGPHGRSESVSGVGWYGSQLHEIWPTAESDRPNFLTCHAANLSPFFFSKNSHRWLFCFVHSRTFFETTFLHARHSTGRKTNNVISSVARSTQLSSGN